MKKILTFVIEQIGRYDKLFDKIEEQQQKIDRQEHKIAAKEKEIVLLRNVMVYQLIRRDGLPETKIVTGGEHSGYTLTIPHTGKIGKEEIR